jgi:alpha-1,6-mannosyltransferase
VLVAGYLFMELIAGAPASPLVPALPREVGLPAWNIRGAALLGLDRQGRTALTVLALTVMAALVAAFLTLVRESWRGRVRLAPVMVAGGASLVLSMAGPLLLSRDVYSYAAYGRMFALHDANPYVLPPSAVRNDPFTPVLSPQWRNTRSDYGPAFTLISAGIARASSGSPEATIRSFQVLAGAALAGAALLAAAACRRVRPERTAMAAAVVALDPVLVLHTVGGGHNDALAALLLAAALWLSVRGGSLSGEIPGSAAQGPVSAGTSTVTVLLTLAALVKLSLGVALAVWVWLLWRGAPPGRRVRVEAVHAVLVVATGTAATAPLWAGFRTLRSLSTLTSLEGWASGVRLVARGAEAVARALGGSGAATATGRAIDAAFLLVLAAALWRLLSRATPPAAGPAWGTSLLLLALAIPIFLPWYAAWFLLFLPLLSDDVLIWIGLGASVLLALTGIPAEPSGAPGLWQDMVLAVHYGAAPIMLGLFAVAVSRVLAAADPSVRTPLLSGRGS